MLRWYCGRAENCSRGAGRTEKVMFTCSELPPSSSRDPDRVIDHCVWAVFGLLIVAPLSRLMLLPVPVHVSVPALFNVRCDIDTPAADVVIGAGGTLVGRVITVSQNSAEVRLITDPEFALSVRVACPALIPGVTPTTTVPARSTTTTTTATTDTAPVDTAPADSAAAGDTLFSGGCGRLFEGTPAQMADSLARLAALPGDYAPPHGHLLLAYVDGELAGCGAFRPLADVDYANACEMKRLYVRRAFRRFGLGRQLAQALMDHAVQAGYSAMLLDTLDDMEVARSLYGSLGFQEVAPYYFNPLPGAHYLCVRLGP